MIVVTIIVFAIPCYW